MIKFMAVGHHGDTLLGFGLTEANINRMKLGNPVVVRMEQMGPGAPFAGSVLILYGQDEAAIWADFKKKGLIGKETIVHGDPEEYPMTPPSANLELGIVIVEPVPGTRMIELAIPGFLPFLVQPEKALEMAEALIKRANLIRSGDAEEERK